MNSRADDRAHFARASVLLQLHVRPQLPVCRCGAGPGPGSRPLTVPLEGGAHAQGGLARPTYLRRSRNSAVGCPGLSVLPPTEMPAFTDISRITPPRPRPLDAISSDQ